MLLFQGSELLVANTGVKTRTIGRWRKLLVVLACYGCLTTASAFSPTPDSVEQFDYVDLYEFWGDFDKRNTPMVNLGWSYLGAWIESTRSNMAAFAEYRRAYEGCVRSGQPLVSGCVFEVLARDHSFDPKNRVRNWLASRLNFPEFLQDPLTTASRVNDFFERDVRVLDPEAYALQHKIEQDAGVSDMQRVGLRLGLGAINQLKQTCGIGLHFAQDSEAVRMPLRYGLKTFPRGPEGIYICKSRLATETCNALAKTYLNKRGTPAQDILLTALKSICRLTDENGAFIEDRKGREN